MPGRGRATLLIAALASCAVTAAAAPKVDVVVLRNGSRVIGELKSMSHSRIELSTDDMGTLQIEWDNVAQLTAPEFFEVEDMHGGLHFGSLKPGPGEGTLEVEADWGNDVLKLAEVASIELVKRGFWAGFRGSVDLGASYTSASELLQIQADGDLHYRRPKFEATARADAVFTTQPDVEDTQRGSLTLAYSRLLPNRHRVFTQGTLEQNRELGFELRSSLVGGWAYLLARDRRNELVGGAGLAVNREKPTEGESTTNLEGVIGFEWANFAYDFPNTDVRIAAYGYYGLNQWGRFRLESSAQLRRELFRDFYFGLKAYESYDSEPATAGAQKNDWGLSFTLGYSF
jgi:hypothetical protein